MLTEVETKSLSTRDLEQLEREPSVSAEEWRLVIAELARRSKAPTTDVSTPAPQLARRPGRNALVGLSVVLVIAVAGVAATGRKPPTQSDGAATAVLAAPPPLSLQSDSLFELDYQTSLQEVRDGRPEGMLVLAGLLGDWPRWRRYDPAAACAWQTLYVSSGAAGINRFDVRHRDQMCGPELSGEQRQTAALLVDSVTRVLNRR